MGHITFAAVMGAVRNMDFSRLGWDDEQAGRFASALPFCSCLTKLDLGWNKIGIAGARLLASAIPWCISLQSLNLRKNCITHLGEQAIRSAWQRAGKEDIRLDLSLQADATQG